MAPRSKAMGAVAGRQGIDAGTYANKDSNQDDVGCWFTGPNGTIIIIRGNFKIGSAFRRFQNGTKKKF